MRSIGIVPIVPAAELTNAHRPPWIVPIGAGIAVVGRKLDVPSDVVTAESEHVPAVEMNAIEESWIDLLDLRSLLSGTAMFPPPGPGGSYPQWSRVHYLHRHMAGEGKFYVICSADLVNARAPAVTVVRLTSRPRGLEFPEVAAGMHACAGNVTSFPLAHIDRASRPPVRSLPLDRMRRIAAAVAITHGLERALGTTTASLESLLS